MNEEVKLENVAVSTRVRLARNFEGYPFPNRLKDEKRAKEIVMVVAAALNRTDAFKLYHMNNVSDEQAEFLKERYLISQDLIDNRRISAALVSKDESISVMINEEDHIREQYFTKGFDFKKAYERISGIDDIVSESIAFAYDDTLGFLTACPTNLGTGLRASVMLFLPAITRRNLMRQLLPELKSKGLTVRGAYGEGSGTEGALYQISNEVTLGWSEEKILSVVEGAVEKIVLMELLERDKIKREEGLSLADAVLRSYGILTNCIRIDAREFLLRMADVKFGVALGYLEGSMEELDNLIIDMRPANINRLNGAPMDAESRELYRAEYAGKVLRSMQLITEKKRNDLLIRR